MKLRTSHVVLSLVGAMALAVSCSATNGTHFTSGAGNGNTGGGTGSSSGDTGIGGNFVTNDAGSPPPCQGLQCGSQTDNCAAQGKPPTTISGVVYDPAGALQLYNVYAYIPNTKPDPILAGSPTCTQCQAPASGDPVIGALTDADGKFTLQQGTTDLWGVPSGDNLPLVLQIGKWRRQIVMPHITACQDNPLPDPSTASQKLRLPAKTSEGDMPYIAFTSGCDPAECFLRHIGIDDSEFVSPANAGNGHVVFYTGQDAGSFNGNGNASQVAGGNNWTDTYAWWTQKANLMKYDIVFNACECNPNDRGAGAYTAMHDYLDSGGRVFTTHYYYNWFAPPTGPSDFTSVVNWAVPNEDATDYGTYFIDTTFPKGKVFSQWLQDRGVTTTPGQITLSDTRFDMSNVNAGTTRWIYDAQTANAPSYSTMYMSFNAPTTQPAAMQCGRAVYSDVHLSGTSDDTTFPNECANADFDGSHAINEKALEFLFFDLSSCVQDNSQPPPPPPPQK